MFAFGYKLTTVTGLDPGFDTNDETFFVFGQESPDLDKQTNFGTLQMTLYDLYVNNAILDLACRQDPGAVGVRQYLVDDLEGVDVWANVKAADNSSYVKSMYFPDWTPTMPVPSGAPNDKAQLQIQGNCGLIEQYQSAWLFGKKVLSTAVGQIGKTLVVQPRRASTYAVSVLAYKDDTGTGGTFNYEKIPVTPTMVTQGGAVSFTEIGAALTQLTQPITGAYILFLQTGSGVYPATGTVPDKLRT